MVSENLGSPALVGLGRALVFALLPLLLVYSACNRSANDQLAVAPAWGALADHLSARGTSSELIAELRRRSRKQANFRPYPGDQKRARDQARRMLQAIAEPGRSLKLLEPPVAWGADPDKSRTAHFRRNALVALRPLLTLHIETGESRYLAHLNQVMLDWVAYNLVEQRKNPMMWHAMGTGLRGVVLAYLIEQALRAEHTNELTLTKFVWAAKRHCEVLANPRLFHEGNRGIYMMLGLKALVHVLPELAGAEQFASYADSNMEQLLDTRFSDEGFHLEHSPEYHIAETQSLQSILDMGLFHGLGRAQAKLFRARNLSYQLFHPNGDRVMLGDSSRDAGASRWGVKEHRQFLESEGREGTAPASGLQVHPDVGYAFFRSSFEEKPFSEHSYLFFASGFHSQHHKHADHLSFEWSDAGQPILIDSGKYDYSRGKWREFFVSTRAGNAVEVDGNDYSTRATKPWGSGLAGWGSSGPLHFVQASVEYSNLKIEQVRTLVLRAHSWLCVVDQLKASKAHTYRQWFQLHEDFELTEQGDSLLARGASGPTLHVQALTANVQLTREVARGQLTPRILGWLSPSHRKKVKRFSLAFRAEGESVLFVTLFALGEKARAPRVKAGAQGLEIRFSTREGQQRFRVTPKKVEHF